MPLIHPLASLIPRMVAGKGGVAVGGWGSGHELPTLAEGLYSLHWTDRQSITGPT